MLLEPLYLNGKWVMLDQAFISPLDRGFLFADACYEVLPIYNSIPFHADAHLQRLDASLNSLGIPNPHTTSQWLAIIQKLTTLGAGKFHLYLQVTRGCDTGRSHTPNRPLQPTVFAFAERPSTPETNNLPKPISVQLTEDFRWSRCDIKSTALVASVMAKNNAINSNKDDAIFHRNQCLSESTTGNLFVVKDGVIKTPKQSQDILSGVTRSLIIDILKQNDIPCIEEDIHLSELENLDELWLTGSTKELVPVIKIDNRAIGNGKIGETFRQVWALWCTYTASAS